MGEQSLINPAGFGSDEVRNQVSGHLESRTYRASYQDQNISLDVANLVRGQDPEDALMRKLNHMGVDADPNANVPLPPEAHLEIAALPDMVALDAECKRLTELVKRRYGTLTSAPNSDPLVKRSTEAKQKFRAKKECYRSQRRNQLRRDFFVNKDNALVEQQWSGDSQTEIALSKREATPVLIAERANLASLIGIQDARSPPIRSAAVQTMADLCSRVEPKGSTIHTGPTSRCSSSHPEQVKDEPAISMQCHGLQCLFCLGDEELIFEDRTRTFTRPQALWRHVKIHLEAIEFSCDICCPHPICATKAVTMSNIEHLLNHAQTTHGVRLQAR